jgi:acetyltransferase-like isoleucine patch superfamily enzyme
LIQLQASKVRRLVRLVKYAAKKAINEARLDLEGTEEHPNLICGKDVVFSIHESALINGTLRLGSGSVLTMQAGSSLSIGLNSWIGPQCVINLLAGSQLMIGDKCWFLQDNWVEVGAGSAIKIGNGTTVQKRCELHGEVKIGQNCLFAPSVFVSSGGHSFDKDPALTIREQDQLYSESRPVVIGSNVWLGIRSWIAPGITIADGTVVGANSVVTKSTLPYSVNAGVPARLIRTYK